MDTTQLKPSTKLLMAMKELLSDETRWTQHAVARNAAGFQRIPASNEAVSWCLVGAEIKCADWDTEPGGQDVIDVSFILRRIIDELYRHQFANLPKFASEVTFNDSYYTHHSDIMRVLDAAIERSKEI